MKHLCPFCCKQIARAKTKEGSFKGLLSMHVKHKHPDQWGIEASVYQWRMEAPV